MRYFLAAALFATGAIPFATASAQAPATPPPPSPMIDGAILDVIAEGSTTRVPDVATVRSGVVTQASTAAAALADNAARMGRVLASLKAAGVAARDIETTAVTLSPQYRYADNQAPAITGYQATNTVSVRLRDIARSGAILDLLVAQGANQIDGPTLSLAEPDAAMDEARVDAVTRARARAVLYARAAGLSVARILSISEGADQPPAPGPVLFARAKEVSSTQILPGESRITATVLVRFLLK